VTGPAGILELVELDLLRAEAADKGLTGRLRKLGFAFPELATIDRLRDTIVERIERRWLNHYERARVRYGRGLAVVRGRVCQGCFMALPTSAMPAEDQRLTTCESCGRILYWR